MQKKKNDNTNNLPNLAFIDISRPNDLVFCYAQASAAGVCAQGKSILEYVNAQPSIVDMLPSDVRAIREGKVNPFDHSCHTSVRKEDRVIPGAGGDIPVRFYHSTTESITESAALLYFHGGGFVLGDIESYDSLMTQLAWESGLVIISVGYRLAPETPFPGALEDACCAFLWLFENSGDYGIDPLRIAIGGDSAGGNLAASVCLLNRDQAAPMPAFQLLIYPTTIANDSSASRELFAHGLLLTKDIIEWFHDYYIPRHSARDPRFHILSASNHADLPPAFILTAGFDPLRDEGKAYADKLHCSGVPVRHSCYSDMFHGFINMGALSQARNAVAECAAVLKSALSVFEKSGY